MNMNLHFDSQNSPQRSPKMADVATLLLANHKKQKARELERLRGQGSMEDVNNQPFLLLPDRR